MVYKSFIENLLLPVVCSVESNLTIRVCCDAAREGATMTSEPQRTLHVCHVTTVHSWNDVRIFQRMCCSLAEMGLRVTLVAPVEEERVAEGVRVIPTGLRGKLARNCGAPFLLPRLRRIDCDIYHFHDPELLPWMSLFQALNPSSAVVYDVHEYNPNTVKTNNYFKYNIINNIFSFFFVYLEKFMASRLRGVIGVTEPIANRFRDGRARVAVIRNLVKLESISAARASGDDGIASLAGGNQLLVLGGTIDRWRGMEELVEAMGLLKERGLQFQLLCIGEPSPKGFGDHLLALADRHGIAGRVTFLGRMPFGQYQQYVAQSRLGMVLYGPNKNNLMTVPNRLYEFMGHGIPIIVQRFP